MNPNAFAVPRTFKLYEELEKAEHAQQADQSISYGLVNGKSSDHPKDG